MTNETTLIDRILSLPGAGWLIGAAIAGSIILLIELGIPHAATVLVLLMALSVIPILVVLIALLSRGMQE